MLITPLLASPLLLASIAACLFLFAAPLFAADTLPLPEYYTRDWDDAAGLWKRTGAGHTLGMHHQAQVHEGRSAAGKLIAAGLDGLLGRIPTGQVLAALQSMQVTEGPKRGCFRWYLEEKEIRDTNAAFFTGLPLVVLRLRFSDQLAKGDLARLDEMIGHLAVWFEAEARHNIVHYPNKFLGDLVCAWLLAEATGKTPPALPRQMLDSARYWREEHWGWGEHMSDIYAGVCLDELAMLLLLSKKLPPDIRKAYEDLRDELLAIDDAFAAGPRVPAIRSYAFTVSPKAASYRSTIRVWAPAGEGDGYARPIRGLAFALGWHDSVPPPAPPAREADVPCFGGARARAIIEGPLRVGALSRFPIMEGIDHLTWGLSWQSFPVAAWHADGGWIYLQWETAEGGERRAHPTENRSGSYLHNALSAKLDPPPVGRTWSLRVGKAFVILRDMPRWSPDWPEVVDRLRAVDLNEARPDETHDGPWSRLRFAFAHDAGTLHVASIRLREPAPPTLASNAFHGVDWSLRHPATKPDGNSNARSLWVFSLDGSLADRPVIEHAPDPAPGSWRLNWKTPAGEVVVRLRPGDESPLTLE